MQSQSQNQTLSAADLQIIELYFDPQVTTHDIAARLGVPLFNVLSALERPEIVDFIERISALNLRRARDISLSLLPDNIERLQQLAQASKNEEIARKAASAVMRLALRREAPGRSAAARHDNQRPSRSDTERQPSGDSVPKSLEQPQDEPRSDRARGADQSSPGTDRVQRHERTDHSRDPTSRRPDVACAVPAL